MADEFTIYRSPLWVRAFNAAGVVLAIAATMALVATRAPMWQVALLALLALVFAVGLAEAMTSRVILGQSTLYVRTNFRTTTVNRDQVVRVEALKGVPVALKLKTDVWLKLPSHGGGPHPNTIRSWVRKESDDDQAGPTPVSAQPSDHAA